MHRKTLMGAAPGVLASLVLASLALAAVASLSLAAGGTTRPPRPAQPGPTATAGPSPTAILPPPSIAGDWSITRTWYRSCPACAYPVARTTTWRIGQFGIHVTVDTGPRGEIVGAPDGSGYLSLGGVESSGPDVYRFLYATLRVRADGAYFEGGFNGSETIANPCGNEPPLVTCSASGGWLTARRLGAFPTSPTPPGPPPPTDLPTPFPLPSATATAPRTATPTASVTPTPSATPSPTATATAPPLFRAWLPALALQWPDGTP